jgi:hypothetical protein
MTFDNSKYQKTKELIVYVAYKLASESNYGAILLNKALYFIDNVSYLKRGKPVSDFRYIKQKNGPTPEPSTFLSLRDELISDGILISQEKEYFGRIQKKLIAIREPLFDLFDKEEIILIDEIISEVSQFNGAQISDITHQYPSWQVAKSKEELPYYTFLLSSKVPTPSDIAWAKEEIHAIQSH